MAEVCEECGNAEKKIEDVAKNLGTRRKLRKVWGCGGKIWGRCEKFGHATKNFEQVCEKFGFAAKKFVDVANAAKKFEQVCEKFGDVAKKNEDVAGNAAGEAARVSKERHKIRTKIGRIGEGFREFWESSAKKFGW